MPVAFPFIIVGIALFYYLVNPFLSDYPLRCVWHAATNTQCPACGMQRALHLLVHGNVSEALSCNYFFVISIPFALIAVLAEWYNYNHTLTRSAGSFIIVTPFGRMSLRTSVGGYCAMSCPYKRRVCCGIYCEKEYQFSRFFICANSFSNMGVNTLRPIFSSISSIFQKRPPSVSVADGDNCPLYMVQKTYTSSFSISLS